MADIYNFNDSEKRWKDFWKKEKIHKFNLKSLNGKKKIYSIDTPPPYISGKMHIGHAFSYAQQDFIARFRRMFDGMVFYPFGTDDNGLPTEKFVEKTNNIRSKNMSRADFIELCLKTLKDTTMGFVHDWVDIGLSSDFELYYSTIDKNAQRISQKSFVDLYNMNNAYEKEFPTLWCTECQTTIAQAELEDKELPSLFSTLKFSVEGKDLLIATTRPELLGACVAVFVNPKDKRYKSLMGKKAKVPIFDFEVPILADESAQMDKGTGILMVCSYGDKYDAEVINRHKLTPKVIISKNGLLTGLAGNYIGMKVREARKKILEDLKNKNLIAEQKQINHVVNVHDRCGTEIEFIPTSQWFIKILDKKKQFLEQGRKVIWHPEFMLKRYENWVNGLEWDWCISRERHFGVPIPVWHCEKCKQTIIAEVKELPLDPIQTKRKCPKCKSDAIGENKVFDTWMTSSLTPQIASSLIDNKIKIPFSLRPQAHDIIRTWAFYTIAKSYLHEQEIPWKDIIVSGYVTMNGEKMSKSKGNVIDPRVVLQNHGADALRYAASGSKLGEDVDYQEKDLLTGKKFVTKILNASNFVFMNLQGYKNVRPKKMEKSDEIFMTRVNKVIENATSYFIDYEYSKARAETEVFFWKDFCDNYLEIVKNRVYNGTEEEKESAKYILYNSLLSIIKMMAPITPFITEEIYQKHFKENEKDKSIHISNWPEKFKIKSGKEDEKIWQKLVEIIEKVRKVKSEAKKSMKAEIILNLTKEDLIVLEDCLNDLKTVTCSREIKEGKEFSAEFIDSLDK
jgi:valyl-tRNA synthetase